MRARLNRHSATTVLVALATLAWARVGRAQAPPEPAHDVTALAKQTQNPVGDLVSVPFQFNFNTGGDLEDRTFFNLNFQLVIPFRVTSNWNVIARTIVPIDSIPGPDGTRLDYMRRIAFGYRTLVLGRETKDELGLGLLPLCLALSILVS